MLRATALGLTLITGFSGLVYEVSWEKYLATLLGSHSEATAAVLALFLGGLALGYALFGRVTRRLAWGEREAGARRALLTSYGLVEAGIGAWALAFPRLFAGVQTLSTAVPHGSGGLGFAFDVLLSALLIAPPAVLMGGTIPMLTQALARSLVDATRFHALVYALNTAGAFAGALAAGFWLIPALGLDGALAAMAALNLAAGALFVLLGRGAGGGPVGVAPGARAPRLAGLASFAAAALLIGFAMMTIQTVLIRLGGLALGSSQFTFSMVVAVFVLCIAVGSLAVSALPRIPPALLVGVLWAIPVLLAALYGALEDAPYWAHALRALFANLPAGLYPYYAAAFLGSLAALGLPVALAGATLPLIFDHLRREFGELGDTAGRLYSWNTLGSLLGALLGGYLLLFWLDLHAVFRLALVALAAAAALVSWRVGRVSRGLALTLAALVAAGIAWLPPWAPERLAAGLFRNRTKEELTFAGPDAFFRVRGNTELIFHVDDPNSSVSVFEVRGEPQRRSLKVNGKPDGSVPNDLETNVLLSLFPALLAEKAERAFVIGLGTGVSAGELAQLASVREVTVAEISRGVIRAAPLFGHANHGVMASPKLRIAPGDAYRSLVRSPGGFDVIASEPSNPWVGGVEMLYSAEFLRAARDRLAPGGVYGQWLQTYEIDAESIALVLRTYAAVFDHVAVWFTRGADLLLLGIPDPRSALDLERILTRAHRPDFAAGLARAGIRDVESLLAHELLPLGVVHAAELEGPIHTLHHPRLSYAAARAFFTGGQGELPVTAALAPARVGWRNSLLRRYAARNGGLGEAGRASLASETCESRPSECIALLAAWAHEVPGSEARRRLEGEIRTDPVTSRTTQLAFVRRLQVLFGDFEAAGTDPVRAAEIATQSFERFYHHAAPFPRDVLARIWRDCGRDPEYRERCARSRERAERTLGDLDEPLVASGPRRPPAVIGP